MPMALSFSILSTSIFQQARSRDRSVARLCRIARRPWPRPSSRLASALVSPAGGKKQPAREAERRYPHGRPFRSSDSQRCARTFGTGDACGISSGQLAMSPARFLRVSVLGHEQRHLMALVEIIEVHGVLRSRKREHNRSLSCAGLQKKYPRSGKVLSHRSDQP
jgi:hypothetical protein